MKILLLGAHGQLGRDLMPRLRGTVLPATRADIDLARPETIRSRLEEWKPDVVVNCAAFNFVDKAESEPEAAFRVNAWGVRELALACAARDCLLVHFSTDHVFGLDRERCTPHVESDAPGPVNQYGLSKLCGEYAIRALCPQHLVIRTCGLYGVWGSGGKGTNFVEAILKRAESGQTLRVVADQVCTPTYTVDLADAVVAALARKERGLMHLTNGGSCSWWEFANEICQRQDSGVEVKSIRSDEYGAAASRPAYSVLASTVSLRPWREALAAYLEERRTKKDLSQS